MKAGSTRPPAVLLLHGFFSLPLIMALLARDARTRGWHAASPFYASWRWPLARVADHVAAQIARTPALHQASRLDIVAHSMGGTVARALIARKRPANLGRVVCLGTPHLGSEIADKVHLNPLAGRWMLGAAAPALVTAKASGWAELLGRIDYPLGNLAGTSAAWEGPTARLLPEPNDGKVSLASTHCEGESDHIALPVPHRLLPLDAEARRQSWAFLDTGGFDHQRQGLPA